MHAYIDTLADTAVEEEYHAAKTVYKDPGADGRRRTKLANIYAEHHNCKPWKLFANMLVQAPMFASFFFGVKDMARRYPDFAQGGLLWAQDLSVCDPLCVLPLIASLSLLATLEGNLRSRQALMEPMHFKMQLGIQRIICFSLVPLLIGLKYPAGVFVYWVSNNLATGLQVAILNSSRARQAMRLPAQTTVPPPFSVSAVKARIDASLSNKKRN